MTKNGPTVSVIIPTYNRAGFVRNAVESALGQRGVNVEVIVVDDGSTDETRLKLLPYEKSIRYIYKKNGGVSSARNLGIREANSEWLAFLDSDDLWIPDKLELQLRCLTEAEADVCFSDIIIRDENWNGIPEGTSGRPEWYTGHPVEMLLDKPAYIPTMVARRELLLQAGLFDESLIVAEDSVMVYKLAELAGKFVFLDRPTLVVERRDIRNGLTGGSAEARRVQAFVTAGLLRSTLDAHPEFPLRVKRKLKRRLGYHLYRKALVLYQEGNKPAARVCALQALLSGGRNRSRLKSALLLCAPDLFSSRFGV